MTKKKTIEFEEGWADELDLTQEELDALMDGIMQLVETGEILDDSERVDDLPEDEQAQIYEMLDRKQKRTRH